MNVIPNATSFSNRNHISVRSSMHNRFDHYTRAQKIFRIEDSFGIFEGDSHEFASNLLSGRDSEGLYSPDDFPIHNRNFSDDRLHRFQSNKGAKVMRQTLRFNNTNDQADYRELVNMERNLWNLIDILHRDDMAREYANLRDELNYINESGSPMEISARIAIDSIYGNAQLRLWDSVVRWLQQWHEHEEGHLDCDQSEKTNLNGFPLGDYLPNTTDNRLPIDPDAPYREPRTILDVDDADDELELLVNIWSLIQSGALYYGSKVDAPREKRLSVELERLCYLFGQPWRISSLQGGIPTEENHDSPEQLIGNPFRITWKICCEALAANCARDLNMSSSEVTCAIYSLLSGGNVRWIEKCNVLQSWQSRIWAHARCVVDANADMACIKNADVMQNNFVFIEGIDETNQEKRKKSACDILSKYDTPGDVFDLDSVSRRVPHQQKLWYNIFSAIIKNTFDEYCKDLANVVCGKWENYCENFPEKLHKESGKYDHACDAYEGEIRRQAALVCIYLTKIKNNPVANWEKKGISSSILEAIVLAYMQYLILDSPNIHSNYISMPVYLEFLQGESLRVHALAALVEVVSVMNRKDRETIFESWQAILAYNPTLLLNASRSALRSVIGQWPDQWPESGVPRVRDTRLNAQALQVIDDATLFEDILKRTQQIWKSLNHWDHLEAIAQGLAIVRQMINRSTNIVGDDDPWVERAKEFFFAFLPQSLLEEHEAEALEEESNPQVFSECIFHEVRKLGQPILGFERSILGVSQMENEIISWKLFFDVCRQIKNWQQARSDDDMQAIVESANGVAITIRNMLQFRWLIDERPISTTNVRDTELFAENELRDEMLGHAEKEGTLRIKILPVVVENYITILSDTAMKLKKHEKHEESKTMMQEAVGIMKLIMNDDYRIHHCFPAGAENSRDISERIVDKIRKLHVQLI